MGCPIVRPSASGTPVPRGVVLTVDGGTLLV
jgi:hypothetical protein